MKRTADFIVNRRGFILVIMLLLAAVNLFFMQKVEINEDLTKYLPPESEMRTGLDIMSESFPEIESVNTLRVMLEGLTDGEKDEVMSRLAAIEHVTAVRYEKDSPDYNSGDHTLFVLEVDCEFMTPEMKSVEKTLDTGFTDLRLSWARDYSGMPEIPTVVLLTALGVLLTILFIMCSSWLEPFIFLFVIGCAVAVNMGTNLIMGSISSITFSIAALLQMALSMDYSIMLSNRYRQEKEFVSDSAEAMKAALANSFSSIASSSLTTVVGLIMLVFMSFRIGLDLGVVLAKGVFISMICVLTMLPGMLLLFDRAISRTAKAPMHISMRWAAAFSFRLRFGILAALVLLFAGSYFLQQQTGISYTLHKDDAVADVFPSMNQLVLVYENSDEAAAAELAEKLEENDSVSDISSYHTVLDTPYTADELSAKLGSMSSDFDLDTEALRILYYSYYHRDASLTMTASGFLSFISDMADTDGEFSDLVDDDMRAELSRAAMLSDAEKLTTAMTSQEMAAFFDMQSEQLANLYMMYMLQQEKPVTGDITLGELTDFILNELADDTSFSGMFTEEALLQLRGLSLYGNKAAMLAAYTYPQAAQLLGMPEQLLQGIYYQVFGTDYASGTMTLDTILGAILSDTRVSAALDAGSMAQLTMLQGLILGTLNDKTYSPAEFSALLGMSAEQAKQLAVVYTARRGDTSAWTMSVSEFLNFLVDKVLSDETYSVMLDESLSGSLKSAKTLCDAVVSGKAYSPEEMFSLIGSMSAGLDADTISLIYIYADAEKNEDPSLTLTVEQLFEHLYSNILTDPRFSSFIDDDMRAAVTDAKQELDEGKLQLVSDKYSRMIISSVYPEEAPETTAFIDEIKQIMDETMKGEHYVIGNSAMVHEMQQTYDREFLIISLLTAAAIFLIVAITFRSLCIPVILVLLVQTGVFISVVVTGYLSGSIYYLAMLIVECILMGSTIDYGILFTNYYKESRRSMDIRSSLEAAYAGSTHTILTSGLILVLITAIVGRFFEDAAVSAIVKTISLGALSASLLILFILPGVLAAVDRLVFGKTAVK